ncbi:hypothetical protein PCC7424_3476 [Gloeothece citriformis PCC 7424]|uniref:DUF6737 domain-containing protein n=1 Tax=Gloeothece citriformis (strain PCC 7424) TaxID=65393 RepID=B7KFF3_GLOC7|nr:hypothetical protein PCC7424_3476 [Gloeothece citriformis PCC 7424]
MGGSWLMFQTIWVTVLVAMPILVWWIYFLILWPKFVRSQILLTSLEPSQDSPNFNR